MTLPFLVQSAAIGNQNQNSKPKPKPFVCHNAHIISCPSASLAIISRFCFLNYVLWQFCYRSIVPWKKQQCFKVMLFAFSITWFFQFRHSFQMYDSAFHISLPCTNSDTKCHESMEHNRQRSHNWLKISQSRPEALSLFIIFIRLMIGQTCCT